MPASGCDWAMRGPASATSSMWTSPFPSMAMRASGGCSFWWRRGGNSDRVPQVSRVLRRRTTGSRVVLRMKAHGMAMLRPLDEFYAGGGLGARSRPRPCREGNGKPQSCSHGACRFPIRTIHDFAAQSGPCLQRRSSEWQASQDEGVFCATCTAGRPCTSGPPCRASSLLMSPCRRARICGRSLARFTCSSGSVARS